MSILSKINVIMGTVPAIGREGKIVAGNAQVSVRKADDVFDAVFPLMATHGVVITKEIIDLQQKSITKTIKAGQPGSYEKVYEYVVISAKFTFTDTEDNSSISSCSIGCGMDDQDKALSKAQTVALRIALTEVFAIPFHEVDWKDKRSDDDAATAPITLPKKPPSDAARQILDDLEALKTTCRKMAEKLGANKSAEIAENILGDGQPIDYSNWSRNQWDLYKTKLEQAIHQGLAKK
jgi:hypothetical protein